MTVEYVKFREDHLELLIDVFQLVVDYKHRNLTKHNWDMFEKDYLPKAIDAISNNQFKVADPHNNIITWIIDQIIHSRKVLDGIAKSDWIPLPDLDRVQDCLATLRAASRGQISYNIWASGNTTFNNLFD
jgi:hypothetical protein